MNDPIHFLNLEYWMRILYECVTGTCKFSYQELLAYLVHIWQIVAWLAYFLALLFIVGLIYSTIRLYQVRKEEEPQYATIEAKEAEENVEHSRWKHVLALIDGLQESEWKQAVIEADIMLEDILRERGYPGQTVAERLQGVKNGSMASLEGLWDAHKVRNRIAHEGSSFVLDERLAYRTVKQYENFFHELGVI